MYAPFPWRTTRSRHGDGLVQVARLVEVEAALADDAIGEQPQRHATLMAGTPALDSWTHVT